MAPAPIGSPLDGSELFQAVQNGRDVLLPFAALSAVPPAGSIYTAAHTLKRANVGKIVGLNFATAGALTVPQIANVARWSAVLAISMGAGAVTLTAGSGVTLLAPSGLVLASAGAMATLIYLGAHTWAVGGGLTA